MSASSDLALTEPNLGRALDDSMSAAVKGSVAVDTDAVGGTGGIVAAETRAASSAAQGALLRAQLAAEQAAGARLPQALTGYTRHGLNQAISRDGVGVGARAIMDAWQNPLGIVGQSGGRFVITGQNATIVVNAEGQIISTWASGSAGLRAAGSAL